MGIKDSLEHIFELYPGYATGQGIGKDDQLWTTFEALRESIAKTLPVRERPTLKVEFSVGKGRLTRLPWVAIMDRRETTSTQSGVYVVLLFREDMTGAYLCFSQGVTEHEKTNDGDAVAALERRRDQVLMPVCTSLLNLGFVKDLMELRSDNARGKLYETGTAVHKFYSKDNIPPDQVIESDLTDLLTSYDSYLATKSVDLTDDQKLDIAEGQRVWIFQANSKKYEYKIPRALNPSNSTIDWKVTRYRNEIKKGDIALFWESGAGAGIYAVGQVDSLPVFHEDDNDWKVTLRYQSVLSPPLLKAHLKKHHLLKDLRIIHVPNGTNFAVSPEEWREICGMLPVDVGISVDDDDSHDDYYTPPGFTELISSVQNAGLIFTVDLLKRYHLALKTRNFVIVSGISGVGKTSLAECYAKAIGAQVRIVPVAPNWSCNEDLLGYYNPLTERYQHTEFSRFVEAAATAYFSAINRNQIPRPFHLILDEMNLARVEYYFAKFLSAMELRHRHGTAVIELQDGSALTLTPNLYFVGTVNIDETTHGFSDKVFDRAQLVEITHDRSEIEMGIKSSQLREPILAIWDILEAVKPFSFRVITEIEAYVGHAKELDITWEEALDHQIYHKILPKLAGIDPEIGSAVQKLHELSYSMYPITHQKLSSMLKRQEANAITSFF